MRCIFFCMVQNVSTLSISLKKKDNCDSLCELIKDYIQLRLDIKHVAEEKVMGIGGRTKRLHDSELQEQTVQRSGAGGRSQAEEACHP